MVINLLECTISGKHKDLVITSKSIESFHVIRPTLLEVCVRTDPNLSDLLIIFDVFQEI